MPRLPIQSLGVMVSGGDCAGLNAALGAVVHAASSNGWRVVGILDGFIGLCEQPRRWIELKPDQLDSIAMRGGGTLLGTFNGHASAKAPSAEGDAEHDAHREFIAAVRELQVDALIVIGGDGSLRIAAHLTALAGLPMVGLPKTIDNDVPGTDVAVGFASAVEVVSGALGKL